ncbi:unnamed protein product, partial [Mesorhabditis belari]|uniref:Beta-glucuronidase n=1 Tax=Mesorhabditis belari TaxID=2138241 RepID=A0AAF3EQT4_9BILA
MIRLIFLSSIWMISLKAGLFVQKNDYRSYEDLSGLWTFVREESNGGDAGIRKRYYEQDLSKHQNASVMPVPCAFNDMSTEAALRDHVGWVWYQKKEFISMRDKGQLLFLRFESAQYYAIVYFNAKEIGQHIGGHLPFSFDVTQHVRFGAENVITVAVNNTLSWSTIPQADFVYKASKKKPITYIEDITIVANHIGSLFWKIKLNEESDANEVDVEIRVLDGNEEIYFAKGVTGSGNVMDVKPWWPRGMGDPNLYTMRVILRSSTDQILDSYDEQFGFRSITFDKDKIYINKKPFYCLGFGMHEDFDVHGRGYNQAVMTKDLNLFEWMGANCYRTSHYPYAQERIRESDRRGIAVILETPAVGLKVFTNFNLKLHQQIVTEMIERDKNHPSVIMWSISNEPHTEKDEAREYFRSLIDLAHKIDATRPVTVVYGPSWWSNDKTADLLDIVCVNRYYGWYDDMGYLDTINQSVIWDYTNWREKFGKPILVTEYGADSIVGLNQFPSVDFSEQYQNDLVKETHKAFDYLRANNVITGEMIWNFADFMTSMTALRAVGNHKGVFTRNRQAKMAAYTLRDRYLKLLKQN